MSKELWTIPWKLGKKQPNQGSSGQSVPFSIHSAGGEPTRGCGWGGEQTQKPPKQQCQQNKAALFRSLIGFNNHKQHNHQNTHHCRSLGRGTWRIRPGDGLDGIDRGGTGFHLGCGRKPAKPRGFSVDSNSKFETA